MNSSHSTPIESMSRFGIASAKRIAPAGPSPSTRRHMLKKIEQTIAELLAEAEQVEAGQYPADFKDLTEQAQERCHAMARRAIRMLNPDVRIAAASKAAGQIDAMADEAWGRGVDLPSAIDTAREAISRYEALLCAPEEETR